MISENSLLKNRYLITKKHEETGYGTVFLAADQSFKRRVVVKVLHDYLIQDEKFSARFAQAAKSIAALEHPNILGVLDYGQIEDIPYLVTPFVEGENLKNKLKREKKLSLPQISRYLQQATAALDY